MDEFEKRIREKVHRAGILSNGEWVYLVGLFAMAKEQDAALDQIDRLRDAAIRIRSGTDSTIITDAEGQRFQKVFVTDLTRLSEVVDR